MTRLDFFPFLVLQLLKTILLVLNVCARCSSSALSYLYKYAWCFVDVLDEWIRYGIVGVV